MPLNSSSRPRLVTARTRSGRALVSSDYEAEATLIVTSVCRSRVPLHSVLARRKRADGHLQLGLVGDDARLARDHEPAARIPDDRVLPEGRVKRERDFARGVSEEASGPGEARSNMGRALAPEAALSSSSAMPRVLSII